jgi:hypothetical protein
MALSDKVIDVFGNTKTTGTFGVEVEVEGVNLPARVDGFHRLRDGSLRGESAEYVFKGPAVKSLAVSRLRRLYNRYEREGSVINNSYRCSVHVHVNVQDFTLTQVANMFVLYAMFEEYLVKYCGEHREGNLFCLRLQDAEYTVDQFTNALVEEHWRLLSSDTLRYSAINVTSLRKFGSLEFRSMRGSNDVEDIVNWVNLLDKLRVAALRYTTPVQIVEQVSGQGPEEFAQEVFGDLLQVLPLEGDWAGVIFENLRMAQDIAYLPTYPKMSTTLVSLT